MSTDVDVKEEERQVDRTQEIENLSAEQKVSDALFENGQLRNQLRAATQRVDELMALVYNMAQQMITSGYNLTGSGYDLQTLGRTIHERFPLTGAQQEIVNKAKQQQEQSVNTQ